MGELSLCSAFTDPSTLFRVRRNSRKDVYQPPLAANIEKRKTTHLKEQKAFALIREILGRQSRLPMSNLPTWLVLNTDLKRNCATSDEPHTASWTFSQDISSLQLLPNTYSFNGPSDKTPHCGSIHSRSVTSLGSLRPELQ